MTTNKPKDEHPHSPRHWLVFLLLVLVAAALIFFFGVLPRQRVRADIDEQAKDRVDEHPKVDVVRIEPGAAVSELVIPGTTLAYTQAAIYARASGYLTRRLVDIGDHVRKDQLLAVIDAPDLDQQVAQARSAVLTSESNLDQLKAQLVLNKANWERYKVLVARGVFSRQEGDTQEANYRSAEANVQAAAATIQANKDNLRRLTVLQQYERVKAPFTGVITARNVDTGALISSSGTGYGVSTGSIEGATPNSGSSGSATSAVSPPTGGAQGGQIFAMATLDPLRILVSVPEGYSGVIRLGQKASVLFSAMGGETVMGTVSRTSSSIDANSRTLLVEVHISNPTYKYLPGMFVVVNFFEAKTVPPLLVPGEAIVVRNGKNMVAKVIGDKIHFENIEIGRDFGTYTEITHGVSRNDVVVKNVSDEIQENAIVEPVFPKQTAAPATTNNNGAQNHEEGTYGNQGKAKINQQKSK